MNKNALSIITLVGGIGLVKQITGSLSKNSRLSLLNYHFKLEEPISLLFLPKEGYWDEYVKNYAKPYDIKDFFDLNYQVLNKQLEEQKITRLEYQDKTLSAYRDAADKVKELKEKDEYIASVFNQTFIDALEDVVEEFQVVYDDFILTINKETVEKRLSEPPNTWTKLKNIVPMSLLNLPDMYPLVDFSFEAIDLNANRSIGQSMIDLNKILKKQKKNIDKLLTNMINQKIYEIGKEKGLEFPDDFFETVFYDNRYRRGPFPITDPNDEFVELYSRTGYGEFNFRVKKEVYVIPETGYPIKYSYPHKKSFLRRR